MLVLVQEFVLSLVIIMGGGFLLYVNRAPDIAITAITAVIAFWFTRRITESANFKNQSQSTTSQTPTATQNTAAPAPVEQLFSDPIELEKSGQ